jgi:molybdopterin molybdotransferase
LSDDRILLTTRISGLLSECDVLILSGGVSAGRFDYVPSVLSDLGVRRIFHKVAQRPGKPLWFGMSSDGKPVFALPGNPVSTLVCLVRYVLPALDQLCGRPPAMAPG